MNDEDYYIDDADAGLSRETSHPTFAELAPDVFYDEYDEFAPFGSEAGMSALRALEEWYEAGRGDAAEFLPDYIGSLELPAPAGLLYWSQEEVQAYLYADEAHETYLVQTATVVIATALGQLKIEGTIHDGLLGDAMQSLSVLGWLYSDLTRPDWDDRGDALAALGGIEDVLQQIASS